MRKIKALITGASSGLGKEMAYYLSDLGYDLILVSREEVPMQEIKKNVKTNVKIISCDLMNKRSLFSIYEDNKDEDIDIVVNNAGFGLFGNFVETDVFKELEMIDVNIVAVHVLTKLFLRDFVKKNKGYILNVASVAGFSAGPELSTYYATKNYVLKLTMAISAELNSKKNKVVVSALCPGPFKSNFNKVAGVSFADKGMTSKYVAKYGIDKCLKGKMIIIPGLKWKLAIFFERFIPYKIQLKFVEKFQKKKVMKENKYEK